MRILFINPPFLGRFSRSQRSPGIIKSGTMYYPYWLVHAAALAEKHGHAIQVIDCPAAEVTAEELAQRVVNFQPELMVLESVTASWYADCKTAGQLKQIVPDSRICMVGTHVTALWQETLQRQPAIDFIAIGEYDYTLVELAEKLNQEGKYSEIAGLAFRKSGRIQRTADRPLIQDLDQLPWIAPIYKRFLNSNQYYFNLSYHPMVMLIGGRGCNSVCFYCVYPQVIHGHAYRHRSPEHLVGEMLWVQENMPEVREITFEDDNFGADRSFARRFAELVREARVRLPFFANLRTTVDFETLRALRAAGLRNCAVGFESGDDRILRNMRKGQTSSTQHRFVRDAHRLGLLVHGCFMVGFPGETKASMEKTLQLAFRVKPDSAQFYPVMPYPGTSAFAYYQQMGFLATENYRDWLTEDGGHRCVLNLPGLPPAEIDAFCERAFRRFHFRPAYLLYKLGQAIRHPKEGWRSLKAGLIFIGYSLTHRQKSRSPLTASPAPQPADWLQEIRTPLGRMEKLKRGRLAEEPSHE